MSQSHYQKTLSELIRSCGLVVDLVQLVKELLAVPMQSGSSGGSFVLALITNL